MFSNAINWAYEWMWGKNNITDQQFKDEVKESCNKILAQRKQFQRQILKLQVKNKSLNQRALKEIEKNDKNAAKITGNAILKNEASIERFKKMDDQLQKTIFEMESIVTMNQMMGAMKGMGQIMEKAHGKVKIEEVQRSDNSYNSEKEKMKIICETFQETMDFQTDDSDDAAVDKLLLGFEAQVEAKKEKKRKRKEAFDQEFGDQDGLDI